MTAGPQIKIPELGKAPGGGPNRFAPGAKPKNARGTLARILRIYLRYGKSFLAAVLLTVLASGIAVAVPLFVGKAFDQFHIDTSTVSVPLLGWILTILALLHVTNWLITTLSGVITLKVSQKLVHALRAEFFAKMQKLPLFFFDTHPHGDTMSRLTNDVDNISSTIAQTTTQLVSGILTIAGSLAVMIVLNVPLTLTVLVSVPLVVILTRVIAGKSRAYFLAQQRGLGSLNGIIEENILGMRMVKAFGRRRAVMDRFAEINVKLCDSSRRAQTWAGFMMPLMNVINNLVFALVAIVGGVLSLGGLGVGTVVSFLSYSKQFGQPLNSVAGMFNTIQQALAGAERVFEILDQSEETPDSPQAGAAESIRGDVKFEHVSFAYEGGARVLEDVNFSVKAGQTVALVGETGAGKTTVVNLLMRFYDANAGKISIDGRSVTELTRDSLRRCFSVVLQDTCLFTGTIADNIRYSVPTATDGEVMAAAKLAHAHEFIERLPKGYQTAVSGSAENLSQGQRQLLAISRALLSPSPILILDEATSSVDTKTEKDIQRALLNLMKNRTSFLIAHRLSTVRDADLIMVIGSGSILEQGSHVELMAARGKYYEMVMSQLGKEA